MIRRNPSVSWIISTIVQNLHSLIIYNISFITDIIRSLFSVPHPPSTCYKQAACIKYCLCLPGYIHSKMVAKSWLSVLLIICTALCYAKPAQLEQDKNMETLTALSRQVENGSSRKARARVDYDDSDEENGSDEDLPPNTGGSTQSVY